MNTLYESDIPSSNEEELKAGYELWQRNKALGLTFGWYIYRQQWGQGLESISITNCASKEEARLAAEDMARRSGWTNPRWYEFWRWGHRKVYRDE